MGVVVKIKTTAKPAFFICSWRVCLHNRDTECHRDGGPELDANGQCLIISNLVSEEPA